MIRAAVARKYARALVQAAGKRNVLASVVPQVHAPEDVCAKDAGLAAFLASRGYPEAGKREVILAILERLFPGAVDPITRNFFEALALHHRLSDYRDIMAVFQEALDESEGVLEARVTTAAALSEGEQKELLAALTAATGRKVRLSVGTDPALLAGAVTRIGSTIYDGSVRTRLGRLRAELAIGKTEIPR